MARIYANENTSYRVVEALRALGHDVLTTRETGKAGVGVPDDEVLAFAYDEERVVLTNNMKRFLRLHRQRDPHMGIVTYKSKPEPQTIARHVNAALRHESADGRFLARTHGDGFYFDP